MLSAWQLLLMRRACDRAIGVAIAPIGAIALLPDPDFRRCVFRCVGHVVARQVDEWIEGDGLGGPLARMRGRKIMGETCGLRQPMPSRPPARQVLAGVV